MQRMPAEDVQKSAAAESNEEFATDFIMGLIRCVASPGIISVSQPRNLERRVGCWTSKIRSAKTQMIYLLYHCQEMRWPYLPHASLRPAGNPFCLLSAGRWRRWSWSQRPAKQGSLPPHILPVNAARANPRSKGAHN